MSVMLAIVKTIDMHIKDQKVKVIEPLFFMQIQITDQLLSS